MSTPYEFVNLNPWVRRENLKKDYYAGGQLGLLTDAFDVDWVAKEAVGDYSGEWYAIFRRDGRVFVMTGYFGSCSSCDDLDGANPVEWLRDYVKNVRAFDTPEDALSWVQTSEDFSLAEIKPRMVEALQKII